MSPRSTRRSLAAAALVVVALAVILQLLTAATPTSDVEVPAVDVVDGDPLEPRRCTRAEQDEATVAEIRASVTAGHLVTSETVQACPAAFDHLHVRYVGELIGDLLRRDGGAWVLVNDDDYALEVGPLAVHHDHRGTNSGLSVWLPDDLLAEVVRLGRPGRRGDVVELAGTIRRADPADGGGLTLRADELRVVAPAVDVAAPLDVPQLVFALVASGIAAGLWVLRRRAAAVRRR